MQSAGSDIDFEVSYDGDSDVGKIKGSKKRRHDKYMHKQQKKQNGVHKSKSFLSDENSSDHKKNDGNTWPRSQAGVVFLQFPIVCVRSM